MAATDRYVFAKLDGTGWYASNVTDTPAPSPEDWQAIVDAVDKRAEALAAAEGTADNDLWTRFDRADNVMVGLLLAAVRNMREAER